VLTDLNEFVDRYVALWNEPDAALRRKSVAELFAEDAVHLAQSKDARGHDAIAAVVAEANEEFVQNGGFVFRSRRNADGIHNVVRFNWEMVPAGGGKVMGVGFDFVILGQDGRIQADYQLMD
jgi:hypothetical protein